MGEHPPPPRPVHRVAPKQNDLAPSISRPEVESCGHSSWESGLLGTSWSPSRSSQLTAQPSQGSVTGISPPGLCAQIPSPSRHKIWTQRGI